MSVHIKRIPQVLSGDNFPATDPEDGTYFVFNVAQTSFISGKTIRNDDDTATVTSASEGDMFKYVASGTKWVRQYQKLPIRTDEEIRDVIAAVVQRHANGSIDVDYDDANDALTFSLSDRTTLGRWRSRAAGVTLSDGDVGINGANNQIVVRLTDYDGNDKSTELGSVAVGDQIHIDSGTDDLYLRITGIASTATAYTFTTRLLPGSTAYSDFIVNGSDTLYLRKPVDYTQTTYTLSIDGDTITLTPSSGDAQTITLPADSDTQRSDEDIRDVVAAQATEGENITITEDDAGDTLTYAAYAPTLLGRWQRNQTDTDLTGNFQRATYLSGDEGINISHTDADGYDKETRLDALSANDEIWLVPSTDHETIVRLNIESVETPTFSNSNRFFYTLGTDSDAFTDIADEEEVFIYHVDSANTAILNTQRTNDEIRDLIEAETEWEYLYGSSTTTNTTTGSTHINITAGTSFDDYRELMFIGVHETNGREFSMVFPIVSFNSNNDDVQPNNGHAYLVVRRTGNSTFQFHHKGNEGCLRAILGRR